jgi:hypothetical protein
VLPFCEVETEKYAPVVYVYRNSQDPNFLPDSLVATARCNGEGMFTLQCRLPENIRSAAEEINKELAELQLSYCAIDFARITCTINDRKVKTTPCQQCKVRSPNRNKNTTIIECLAPNEDPTTSEGTLPTVFVSQN